MIWIDREGEIEIEIEKVGTRGVFQRQPREKEKKTKLLKEQ